MSVALALAQGLALDLDWLAAVPPYLGTRMPDKQESHTLLYILNIRIKMKSQCVNRQ
jgi:hypothetical protein